MRIPDDSQRVLIVGMTGSGKTLAGLWHLSLRDLESMPWVIFDFKRDPTIAKIPALEISLGELPQEPGLYVVRPLPGQDDDVEKFLWNVWQRGNIGLYIDEGYMLDKNSDALNAIYTQGRSKRIPVITLSQRPVGLSRFAFSEAEFFQTFFLNDERDRKTVQAFQPEKVRERLPRFHSYYYDVGGDELSVLTPVPMLPELLKRFPVLDEPEPEPAPPEPLRLRTI